MKTIRTLLMPLVVPWFWIWRWSKHCGSLYLRGLLGKLTLGEKLRQLPLFLLGMTVFTVYRSFRYLGRLWRQAYTDYALRQYAAMIGRHYGAEGMAYRTLLDIDADEARRLYLANTGNSRVAPFIDLNSSLVDYRDGERFLDAGCGSGNEIRELERRFPSSAIRGFDLNPAAIRSLELATRDNLLIQVSNASIIDFDHLAGFANGSVDHVILCHVITYLIAPGTEATHALRRRLIDELVRIAAKSVIILTDRIERPQDTWVEASLGDACLVRDDLPGYFDRHLEKGERSILIAPGETNVALFFRKHLSAV